MASAAQHKGEAYSSPASRRAHANIESVTPERDDLRALYEPQDGRTRAEHAGLLHHNNQEARALYERGAAIYGDTLIIPREASGRTQGADTIRIGTHEHAVKNFSRFVSDSRELGEKAAEFVELGKQIAGRTADRHTRLTVFRTYYDRITKTEAGKFRSSPEQRTALDEVLGEMRVIALAMRAEEWANDKRFEFVEIGAWEQQFTAHENEQAQELYDGLTAHPDRELSEDQLHEQDDEARFQSFVMTGEHDSLRLDDLPPRLPANLSQDELDRLRREVLPRLDRQLETGVAPRQIFRALERAKLIEETKERDEIAANLLYSTPAGEEQFVTRQAQLRALYTLRTLVEISRRAEERKADSHLQVISSIEKRESLISVIDSEIERRGFSDDERAWVLESIGRSAAREYRAETSRIAHYEALEKQAQQFAPLGRQLDAETERANEHTAERIQQHRQHFLIHFGMLPENANEARVQLQPALNALRSNLMLIKEQLDGLGNAKTYNAETNQVRNDSSARARLFIALSSHPNQRLPVESFNEYRILTFLSAQTRVPLLLYRGLYKEEIQGRTPERDELYSFQKEYVRYRMQDAETRTLNENALYRDFIQRLSAARNMDELRRAANEIRRENYDREHRPENYSHEREARDRFNEGVKRPLTESQMRQLFLAPAPEQYTDEMRSLRYDKSMSRSERERAVGGLERGESNPSPSLQKLITEFARTDAHDRKQTLRNVNIFIAGLINPPRDGANRISRTDLYKIHEQLSTTERNYLFRVINEKKESLKNDLSNREQERLQQIIKGQDRLHEEIPQPLRLPTDSASFRNYTGAVAWREAELLTEAAAQHNLRAMRIGNHDSHQAFNEDVSERNLETLVTLLRDFKSTQATYAAEHLRAAENPETRRIGELLLAFKDMKRTVNESGQTQYQITIPEDSTIERESWQRLFDHLQPQLTGQRTESARDQVSPAHAREIRRAALADGWKATDPTALNRVQALLNEKPTFEKSAVAVQSEIKAATTLQQRLTVAQSAYDDKQHSPPQGTTPNRLAELRAYTHQVKKDFLASFTLLDEANKNFDDTRAALVKDREERQAEARTKLFADARPELQQRISEYLKTVLRDHKETAFERGRGGSHHAAIVGAIIKDNLKERGISLETLNLTNEQIERTAQEIVADIPRGLQNERERNAKIAKMQAADRSDVNHSTEFIPQAVPLNNRERNAAYAKDGTQIDGTSHQPNREHSSPEASLDFDDEFVEQKTASQHERVQHLAVPRRTHLPSDNHQHQRLAHDNQQREKVLQLTLTR